MHEACPRRHAWGSTKTCMRRLENLQEDLQHLIWSYVRISTTGQCTFPWGRARVRNTSLHLFKDVLESVEEYVRVLRLEDERRAQSNRIFSAHPDQDTWSTHVRQSDVSMNNAEMNNIVHDRNTGIIKWNIQSQFTMNISFTVKVQ